MAPKRTDDPEAAVPPGSRTLAVLHLGEVSGPSLIMRPRLERLARRGPLEVVVPASGGAARSYADIAAVSQLDFGPLTFPRGPAGLARMAARMTAEARGFRRHLEGRRPDLVVIATSVLPTALVASRLAGMPTIVEVMETYGGRGREGTGRRAAALAVLGLHRTLADALVCCSRRVAAQFGGRGRARVETIYPGISPAYSGGDGSAFREAHGLERAAPLLAVIGNVTSGRAQDVAIRALPAIRERHPGATCVIVGATLRPVDRDYRLGLERLARDLGVEDGVVFTDFVDRVADVYAAADVVVNPARFHEPFGRVAPEALVAGRPVVATRVGAIPEILGDGREALLVEPDDPGQIAAAVLRLTEEDGLGARLVEAGRARVLAEFSEERGARAFERVAASVLASRRSA